MGIFDRLRKPSEKKTKPTATQQEGEAMKIAGKQISSRVFRLIRRPHISEKATKLTQEGNVYVFQVAFDAEKIAIKKAIEQLYGVKVMAVRTIRQQGKHVQRGRRMGTRDRWKKALVKIEKGQTIDLYTPAS